jgi:hypothetical protein
MMLDQVVSTATWVRRDLSLEEEAELGRVPFSLHLAESAD